VLELQIDNYIQSYKVNHIYAGWRTPALCILIAY